MGKRQHFSNLTKTFVAEYVVPGHQMPGSACNSMVAMHAASHAHRHHQRAIATASVIQRAEQTLRSTPHTSHFSQATVAHRRSTPSACMMRASVAASNFVWPGVMALQHASVMSCSALGTMLDACMDVHAANMRADAAACTLSARLGAEAGVCAEALQTSMRSHIQSAQCLERRADRTQTCPQDVLIRVYTFAHAHGARTRLPQGHFARNRTCR